jgi:hypothetical protein
MSNQTLKLKPSVVMVAASLGAWLLPTAIASAQAADPAAQKMERVVVTGSSIKRIDGETALPVQILKREDIDRIGAASTEELVKSLSSLSSAGSATTVANASGFGGGNIATVSLRGFRQQVSDQLVTLFGIDVPGTQAAIGHYFIADAGDVRATGVSAGVRAAIAGRVHGSIEYSIASTQFTSPESPAYMLVFAPYASRTERIHDIAAALQTDVPETATHVVLLYRVSNAFARPAGVDALNGSIAQSAADRAPLDSRFDVQVRQSLPFMDFSTAKWEMLIGVRNFFRETAPDQSVYDELLVVHPPKRIVGGLTLRF